MSALRFGYGTNGFGDHRLDDVLLVLAELGYDGVALTLDHPHLDPYAPDVGAQVPVLRRRLDELGLAVVIETGGRYVLDPWRKHQPTLLSREGAERRVDLLVRAVRIAAELSADAVSFWSGTAAEPMPEDEAWQRLAEGCAQVLDAAAVYDVRLGFEPEPGMLVDTLDGYTRLLGMLDGHERFGLTLDIGHCRCLEPLPAEDCVRRHAGRLVNVQIDDMRRGVHEHLPLGEGEVDFPPVLAALGEVGYGGLVSVELPRHGHAAPGLARTSLEFLRDASVPTEVTT
ncbi:MAG: sugar phosphate isomerase/epimerase [Streptosporangiales bacterium]|nr:sugar phosphate isomerase/epimerase [Streptosporangiales bacterium]MBO0890140.1 sugar phosphate isomerase/epimerase [Acidothermales bacterium]